MPGAGLVHRTTSGAGGFPRRPLERRIAVSKNHGRNSCLPVTVCSAYGVRLVTPNDDRREAMGSWTLPRLASLALLTLLLAQPAAAAKLVDVTACGQVVPKRTIGVLTGDLDCSSSDVEAVRLLNGAKLRLSGFTLTANRIGVLCENVAVCRVSGPGTIRRLAVDPSPELGNYAVFSGRAVELRDGVTLENWQLGVFSGGVTILKDVVINGCVNGAIGWPVRAIDSTFSGNQYALIGAAGTSPGGQFSFGRVRVKDSTFSGNLVDLSSYGRPTLSGTTCSTSWRLTRPSTPFSGGDDWQVCS